MNLQGVGVLLFEGAAAADPQRPRIERVVTETVAAARTLVRLNGVTIVVGFSRNLLDAIVTEGLADHFMLEVAGGPPPIWATALSGVELQQWLQRAREVWLDPDHPRDPWFLVGTGASIPQWAGYAVGFE